MRIVPSCPAIFHLNGSLLYFFFFPSIVIKENFLKKKKRNSFVQWEWRVIDNPPQVIRPSIPPIIIHIHPFKKKNKKKTFYYWNRQYLLRTVQVRRSSPVQNFSYFRFRWQTRRGFLMRSSTFRARSLTDQWHFSKIFDEDKKDIYLLLLTLTI